MNMFNLSNIQSTVSCIIGPKQCGKTTLINHIKENIKFDDVYIFDLPIGKSSLMSIVNKQKNNKVLIVFDEYKFDTSNELDFIEFITTRHAKCLNISVIFSAQSDEDIPLFIRKYTKWFFIFKGLTFDRIKEDLARHNHGNLDQYVENYGCIVFDNRNEIGYYKVET